MVTRLTRYLSVTGKLFNFVLIDARTHHFSRPPASLKCFQEDPKDSKLVATEGKGKKGPDFSKIMDAAREAVKAGMTKVTSQILGVAIWKVGLDVE